jgi:D-alanyl-D-alanine carboxypeptidase/D-alanyl-D-alanine-endopeptidase (penicillin-binding protein 4)
MDSVVIYLNKVSDNLAAEAILKTLSAEKFGSPGTSRAGGSLVKAFIAATGADTSRIVIGDGSGLSRYNLASPATIVHLLCTMYRRTDVFDVFFGSLPVAGIDGTLDTRMKGTPAEGNLRAKTGTLSGVSSLSGYVTTADGVPLAFSIMMTGFPNSTRAYRDVQDAIGVYLSSLNLKEVLTNH